MTREEAIVLLKTMFAFWARTHSYNNVEMEEALHMAIESLQFGMTTNNVKEK